MRPIHTYLLIAFASVATFLSGCSQRQPPSKMVQLCLASPEEIPAFVSFMDSIAQENELEFGDRSGATEAELRDIGNKNVPIAHPHINIGADRSGDLSIGAGNLGLPTRQMAISFSARNAEDLRKFAGDAIARLSARWHVYDVPQGRGALPLPNCG